MVLHKYQLYALQASSAESLTTVSVGLHDFNGLNSGEGNAF
jgi:hypothetical protein